jgi:hypothetical protein
LSFSGIQNAFSGIFVWIAVLKVTLNPLANPRGT